MCNNTKIVAAFKILLKFSADQELHLFNPSVTKKILVN
jgi:hypothetical protein